MNEPKQATMMNNLRLDSDLLGRISPLSILFSLHIQGREEMGDQGHKNVSK